MSMARGLHALVADAGEAVVHQVALFPDWGRRRSNGPRSRPPPNCHSAGALTKTSTRLPLGLFGEFRVMARVCDVIAASSRVMSGMRSAFWGHHDQSVAVVLRVERRRACAPADFSSESGRSMGDRRQGACFSATPAWTA